MASNMFSSVASRTMERGQRFPSVHRDDRQTRLNASAASEILSQESRLTKLSRVSQTPKANKISSNDFINQLSHKVEKKQDEKLIQEDIMAQIIARKRKAETDKKNKTREEIETVNRELADIEMITQQKNNKKKFVQ